MRDATWLDGGLNRSKGIDAARSPLPPARAAFMGTFVTGASRMNTSQEAICLNDLTSQIDPCGLPMS